MAIPNQTDKNKSKTQTPFHSSVCLLNGFSEVSQMNEMKEMKNKKERRKEMARHKQAPKIFALISFPVFAPNN